MIRNDITDPRLFIKPVPLPFPSHKGVKIQARSFNVYNATLPRREDVRKDNYSRRRDQMASMGFKTPSNVPYKVIGEPLLLDYKAAVLHGLGQYQVENKENINNESQNSINSNINKIQENRHKSASQQYFAFRTFKRNKELYSIQDEVNRTKYFIHRVKLGHSLFDLLKDEEDKRHKKAQSDSKTVQMSIRPMQDSDEEYEQDSEEEIIDSYNEQQNRNFNTPNEPDSGHNSVANNRSNLQTPYNSENNNSALNNYDKVPKLRTFVRDDTNESNISNRPQTYPANNNPYRKKTRPFTVPVNKSTSMMSTYRNQKSSLKKHKDETKPYTPLYSSLFSKDEGYLMDKPALTRQLCVLLWLLESINVEPPNVIGPLSTCFSVKDLGGEKMTEKALNNLAEVERAWKKFEKKKVESQKKRELEKSRSRKPKQTNFSNEQGNQEEQQIVEIINEDETEQTKDTQKNSDEMSALFDSSLADEDFNKQPSKKTTLADITLTLMNLTESVKEKTTDSDNRLESNRESVSYYDFMTTNREFVNNPSNNINENSALLTNQAGQVKSSGNSQNKPSASMNAASARRKSSIRKKEIPYLNKGGVSNQTIPDHEMELIRIGNVDEMERIFNKSVVSHERRNSKSLKATTGPIHALWTEKVVEFQNKQPSVKKFQKLQEMKEQFDNLIDEKTIDIHKRIEEILKKRVTTCSLKYTNMDLKERGLHNMLKRMNQSVYEYYKFEDMKNTPEPKYYQWYTELEILIETYYNRNDVMLGKLLDRLSVYGKLNAKKQNEMAFFRVLESLRIWELISPDVISAIEFCREKIMEIPVDEFERWFKTKHPKYFVSRLPASAPPSSLGTNNDLEKK